MKSEKILDEKMAKELEKLDVEVDDYMVWGVYKLALGVMKIKWSLAENKAKDADKKLDEIVEMIKKKSADDLHEMMHRV